MAFHFACEKVFIPTKTNIVTSYSRELNEWLKVANNPASKATTHFGTTLYSLVSSESVPGIPEIPSTAKAVILNFSGSGTKSSGKVAMRDAPVYLAHDIALVSFDYPFQGQGSRDMKLFRSWK